jgi:MarR family transcriptional regulator, transcriptional regulator for hemolysin
MENIGYLLSDRSRLLRRAFDDRVRSVGITGPQARLLLFIARTEGENQGFYADQLDVEPITLCRMVDRMADAGLIERRRDPGDRRAWRLHLTDKSKAMVLGLRECVDRLIEETLAGISAPEREVFARILTTIGTNLGDRRENRVSANG